jgi:DNA-binding LytR/AlgR family response regulator
VNTRLKCVLLDDELPGLTYLKILCEQIPEVEVVKAFNDPQKFLSAADNLDFDACILDIEMPKLNGLQVARLLKDKLIIFATAYKQYAADAFDLDATDFVGKPVTKDRLETAIKKALSRKKSTTLETRTLQFNTDKGKALIDTNEIAYITTSEVDSRDKVLWMTDNSYLVLKNISFETVQSQLPSLSFCRINKKQIIALKIVTSFTYNEIVTKVILENAPVKLSLSETYRQEFQNAIQQIS